MWAECFPVCILSELLITTVFWSEQGSFIMHGGHGYSRNNTKVESFFKHQLWVHLSSHCMLPNWISLVRTSEQLLFHGLDPAAKSLYVTTEWGSQLELWPAPPELALCNIWGFISPFPGHALVDIVYNKKPCRVTHTDWLLWVSHTQISAIYDLSLPCHESEQHL